MDPRYLGGVVGFGLLDVHKITERADHFQVSVSRAAAAVIENKPLKKPVERFNLAPATRGEIAEAKVADDD
jgi:hypothetical protein